MCRVNKRLHLWSIGLNLTTSVLFCVRIHSRTFRTEKKKKKVHDYSPWKLNTVVKCSDSDRGWRRGGVGMTKSTKKHPPKRPLDLRHIGKWGEDTIGFYVEEKKWQILSVKFVVVEGNYFDGKYKSRTKRSRLLR